MNQPVLNWAVPSAIAHKLGLVRQRKAWVHAASAIVAALAVLLAAMTVAMLIDYLARLYDSRWRYALTLTALASAAVTIVGWLWVARRRALAWHSVAGEVERHFPQMQERWTTITCVRADANDGEVVHPAMLRRVAAEAAQWEPHVEPAQVVSKSALLCTMFCLTAITAVLAFAVLCNSRQMLVLMRRFWAPGASISATQLVDATGNFVVGRGEPLTLEASENGMPVDRATLFLRSGDAAEQSIGLVAHGQEPIAFSHRIRSVDEPFKYRFRAGDGQTEWYTVDTADRPEIDKLHLTVTPPTYTRQPAREFDKLPQRLAVLEKSCVELSLHPTIPVESVQLRLGEKLVKLTADTEGWYHWTSELKDELTLAPLLTESHGLTNRTVPKCEITVYQDKPPVVRVLTPDDQMAVRPGDTIQITFAANDDVGIGSAELVVYNEAAPSGTTDPVATIPIPLADQAGARSVQQSVELDLSKFGANNGAELSYEIRVREDRGDIQAMAEKSATEPNSESKPDSPNTSEIAGGNSQNDSRSNSSPGSSSSAASNSNDSSDQSKSQVANNDAKAGASKQQPSADGKANTNPATPSESGASKLADARLQENSNKAQQPDSNSKEASSAKPVGQQDKPSTNSPSSEPRQPSQVATNANPSSSPAANPAASAKAQDESMKTAPTSQQVANSAAAPSDTSKPSADPTSKPSSDASQPKEPAHPAESQMANQPNDATTPKSDSPNDPSAARTASSGRQGLNSPPKPSGDPPSDPNTQPGGDQKSPAHVAKNTPQSEKPPAAAGDKQPSTNSSQMAANSAKSPSSPSSSSGDPPPSDSMTKRTLDVPQSSASQRMKLKVDEWAGSFAGQQREKLEIAIAPELEALDQALGKAQRTARGILDELEADHQWRGKHDRDVTSAQHSTADAQKRIGSLEQRTKGTPYAFIGLQVSDIGQAHVKPAESGFWSALQSESDDRAVSVRDGWQHLGRARELLAELRGQFERTRREFKLAESMERVKKMYQVYLENSQQLLQTSDDDPTRYSRKLAELNPDDEYLKRLQEVLEMRRDLQAELGRILAEDPRLLRRFMDSIRKHSQSQREELANLVARQQDLNREVRAWSMVEERDKPRIAEVLLLRHVQDASKLAAAAGELQSRYQTWLPLERQSKDPDLTAATRTLQQMATSASELKSSSEAMIASAQRAATTPSDKKTTGDASTPPAPAAAPSTGATPAAPDRDQAIDKMLSQAQGMYNHLNQMEVGLRQIAARDDRGDDAGFAANRLVETKRLIADTSAWMRQLQEQKAGNYAGAAQVEQYRLAMATDQLAGKLGTIEQRLAGLMQRTDGTLPEPIAAKARAFLSMLDRQATPNQLAAVHALGNKELERATERQKSASNALTQAETLYDDLMKSAIEELDKLPVQDPIADLLDDPTLDELLTQLEQEPPIEELLGIPPRPSNLRIVGDWSKPGGDNALSTGGGAQLLANQMRNNQQQAQRKLDKAYRRAIARALKETTSRKKIEVPTPIKLSDWNRLVSKLGDDVQQGRDKAPPEQYRRAIEQYFAQINRVVADQDKEAPASEAK